MLKKYKPKKCKVCETVFEPRKPLQKVCTIECAIELTRQVKEKEVKRREAKRLREGRESLMTKSDHLKLAQSAFNKFIRARDRAAGSACISCGRNTGAKMNAGHYLSVGSHPEKRFTEDNCHLQCEHCNSYKSGNQQLYRSQLIKKIGLERVEALENGEYQPLKLTIEDIKQIKEKYLKLAREIKGGKPA